MKSNYLLIIFLLFSTFGFAQSYDIGGVVKEKGSGLPIPGVNVQIKNTTKGTSTDFDGKFTLKGISSGATVIFSYIGYKNFEYKVTSSDMSISVSLQDDAKVLDEVVVIGYGTQKVTKVSGSISTVKAADIEKLKPVRVEEALQGRASGVTVIQKGSPGSKPTIVVRGIPSFKGADPVVIIDGVPQTLDDLNAINSADIESLNVLKDASATAIYGVKGGNGVIVVTTKGGKKNQKTEYNFSTYYGVQHVMNKIDVLNATQYGEIINEGSIASGGAKIFPNPSDLGNGTNWQDQVFHDADVVSHSLTARGGGENVTYFLSTGFLGQDGIVGGGDKSFFNRVNVSANMNFQLSPKLKFILNTSYANIKNKAIEENAFNSILGSALNFDPTVSVLNTVPNTYGTYGFSTRINSEIYNPLTKLENTFNENNGNKFFGKAELQYDILKNLKVTSRFGYSRYDELGKIFTPLVFYGPSNVDSTLKADGTAKPGKHNKVNEYLNSFFSYTSETFANYNFNINEKHHFDVTAGISLARSTAYHFSVTREDVRDNSWAWADVSAATGLNTFPTYTASVYTPGVYTASTFIDGVYTPSVYTPPTYVKSSNIGGSLTAFNGNSLEDLTRKNLSYFGRILYDYEDKYLASFSARRDGSIAFGPKNKFANFYAGSLGWVVSKESFFNSNTIDLLKIRGSYGTTGNENVVPQYVKIETGDASANIKIVDGGTGNNNGYTFGGAYSPGTTVGSFANEALRWEKQTQYNAGFDLTMWKNLSLNADYFSKKVDGLLFTDVVPGIGGTSSGVAANIGTTESKGYDFTLGYNTASAKIFKFNSSLTFTAAKNKVTATNSDGTAIVVGGSFFNSQSQSVTRFQKGYTPGYFYGYQTDGLFQTAAEVAASPTQSDALPGDIKFVDRDNNGVINSLDQTKIGDPFPDFTMGLNLGFEYKNFDFNVYTYASVGNDVYRAYERNGNYTNKFADVLNRWTGPGTTNDANNPRYTFIDKNGNIRASDRYVEDGSFVKIKNVLLGYTLPAKTKGAVFTKIRVYIQAKNLFTFTKYSGFDPEIAGGILDTGVDRGNYPQARTISAGLDLKF